MATGVAMNDLCKLIVTLTQDHDPRAVVAGEGQQLAAMLALLLVYGPSSVYALGWPPAIVSAWLDATSAEMAACVRRGLRSAEDAQRLRDAADAGALRYRAQLGLPLPEPDAQAEARQRAVRALARAAGIPRLHGSVQGVSHG